jgi:prevent-host-death family protein
MSAMSTVEARSHFSTLINRVAFGKERMVLTRRGEELAAVVPVEDLRLLERLFERLEDQLDLDDARDALREAEQGGTISLAALKSELGL